MPMHEVRPWPAAAMCRGGAMKALGGALATLAAHAGRLLWLLLSRLALCVLLGATINAALLYERVGAGWTAWQAGHWGGLAGSVLALPLVLASMLAYAVLGYRQGLSAALDQAFRTLSGPLLDLIAERASALLQRAEGAERLAELPARLRDLDERLQGQRWIVRKIAGLLLARLPYADLLNRPEVSERLQAAREGDTLTTLIRRELDRIELPGLGWWPIAALVTLHLGLIALLW
ncbi:MAG: hypothetical protein U1F26_15390 [Lysobacterales bacterium]